MKDVCIIIPMFNKNDLTRKCVEFIKADDSVYDYDIVVIDDGSSERYEDNRTIILRHTENMGFTKSVNDGIIWASNKYEYIMLLNNDTEPAPNFLKNLIEVMDDNTDIGIASSVRIEKDEHGSNFVGKGVDLIRGIQNTYTENHSDKLFDYVDWVPACSWLIRAELIREIGLLDKTMKNFCSDTDYCLRTGIAGWDMVLVYSSKVFHHLSKTSCDFSSDDDQRTFIAKLAGLKYAEIMNRIPLDSEKNSFGKIEFNVVNKEGRIALP